MRLSRVFSHPQCSSIYLQKLYWGRNIIAERKLCFNGNVGQAVDQNSHYDRSFCPEVTHGFMLLSSGLPLHRPPCFGASLIWSRARHFQLTA